MTAPEPPQFITEERSEIVTKTNPLLFKVLVDGKSCHGGAMAWSLPTDGKPGDWHEVQGRIVKCSNGLHLTTEPAWWWKNGAKAYVVEAEGVEGEPDGDDKVVARRARLLREATEAELAERGVYLSGVHTADPTAQRIVASGSASVEAYGSASVEAYDSASVEAYGSASVKAYGSASVEAYGSASVEASRNVTVVSWWGKPTVVVRERAVWIERGEGDRPKIHCGDAAPVNP